jgi:SP family general alpha glucoside:H+ symporter-like MFS transporter
MSNNDKIDVGFVEQAAPTLPGFKTEMVEEARIAAEQEAQMTLIEGIKKYPKAVMWSALLSTALVMEGFDMAFMGSLISLPQFDRKFGRDVNGNFQLTAAWQTGLSNGSACGEILGLLMCGVIAERFGSRWLMIGALAFITGAIFIPFFCTNIQMLLGGEVLIGLAWGALQTVTNVYAAEVCPVVLRAYLTTYVQMCWIIGNIISAVALRAIDTIDSDRGYKIGFALQWIWPVPLIIGIYFAPESPWWLVRRNRADDALKSLKRLTSNQSEEELQNTLALIIHTTRLENEIRQGTSYLDCFKGTDLRRTEITMMVYLSLGISGTTLLGYSTYFMEQAGLSSEWAFDLSIVQFCLGFIGLVCCWFTMKYVGRKTIFLSGLISLGVGLLIIGILGTVHQTSGVSWAIGVMLLFLTFSYDGAIAPLIYALCSEIPSGRLRQKTVVLSRAFYFCGLIVCNVLSPYQLNPTAWNWGAKTGFFWCGIDLICIIYIYFRLPEPKGRSYAELDMLFEMKVPARKFKTTEVDPFSISEIENTMVKAE